MVIKIHIYLILVIAYMFATQSVKTFLCLYLFAIMHELAHMIVATLLGMDVYEMELLPIGLNAKYYGEKSNLKELLICVAGPLASFLFCLFFKNEVFRIMNFSMAILNLIPLKPFDGGRILENVLRIFLNKKNTNKVLNFIENILIKLLIAFEIYNILFWKNYYMAIFIIYITCILKEEKSKQKYIENLVNSL